MTFLASLARLIDALNDAVGRFTAWAALAMVIVQFAVVVLRHVFGLGSIMLQESVVYLHAILFMVGSGYTLLHGGHVRVDIFYRHAAARKKALIDLAGVVIFLIPVCLLIWWVSWPYVVNSWLIFEGSRETSGIQAVFLLKTVIPLFSALTLMQGISLAARSLIVLAGVEKRP
ncbi:MAG TPA: TRAP transporter small permease subunit [Rhodospirillales bacterium]|nr:TRAP transporter small permease subunit [Rhodospirillales bacterium]